MDNFSIFKNTDKKNDKAPDYNISAKIGDKYVNIGACWLKDGAKGKFFSCQLSKQYQDRSGFHIEIDTPKVETPMTSSQPDGSEAIDTSQIPF